MCWCWPCRSPCISIEDIDPSEKSHYRTRPSSKDDLYAQPTSFKKSRYISSVSSVSSDGSSKTSSLPKKSAKHHLAQNTRTTTTNTSSARRTPEKAHTKHRSHSVSADSPPRRRNDSESNGDREYSPSKTERGRNSSTSSSERSSRSKSRRGRNLSTASTQRSSQSKSRRERHPSTASSERTSSSKTVYSAKPKSLRRRRDVEIDPSITKKAVAESVSSGSSTLVDSEEEEISTKNPSSETLLEESRITTPSRTTPSPKSSLRSRRKFERKYITSDGGTETPVAVFVTSGAPVRSSTPQRKPSPPVSPKIPAESIVPVAGILQTSTSQVIPPETQAQHSTTQAQRSTTQAQPSTTQAQPSTAQPKPLTAQIQVPKAQIQIQPPAAQVKPATAQVKPPARRVHRITKVQVSTEDEPFNPLAKMSVMEPKLPVQSALENSSSHKAADNTSEVHQPKGNSVPQTQEEFKESLSSFVESIKLEAFYSPGDPFVKKVSERAAELVVEKATITTNDVASCIPDDIAGMARVALYDVVLLCDDSSSMQQGERIPALKEVVKRIAKITGLFETDGIKVRGLNSREDSEFNNIRTLEGVESAMSAITFNGLYTRIGTQLQDKILKPMVFDKIESNTFTRPLLVSIITDGEPMGEEAHVFKDVVAECRKELLRRGLNPSLVVFQVNQVGNDIQATKFVHGLKRSRNIHCISELLDAKINSFRGNNLGLENWLVDQLTQGITPKKDEY